MKKTVLKAKVQEIVVTEANIEYEGSITVDADIMDAIGVCDYEQVYVNSKTSHGRIMTYFISGERGSRCCKMNGGAANHFRVGETVHLLVFCQINNNETIKPIILK